MDKPATLKLDWFGGIYNSARFYCVGVVTSFDVLSDGLKDEMYAVIESIVEEQYKKGRRVFVYMTSGKGPDMDLAMLLERYSIPRCVVNSNTEPASQTAVRRDVIEYIISHSNFVYISFDGEDNEAVYAIGDCLANEKSFRLSQDKPTKPKHYLVDALMRGMKKQAQELAGRAEEMGEDVKNNFLQMSEKNEKGVESIEFVDKRDKIE